MEPFASTSAVVPEATVLWERCLICQKNLSEKRWKSKAKLRTASEDGITRMMETASKRASVNDTKYIELLDKMERFDLRSYIGKVRYHGSCYANFTSHIDRIEQSLKRKSVSESEGPISVIVTPKKRRSSVDPIQWYKCLFCQSRKEKCKLRNIMTKDTSNFILQNASFDSVLRYRLSGVIGDLIAYEEKYHLSCYSAFKKRFEHNKAGKQYETVGEDEVCFNDVVNELKEGIAGGMIFSLATVGQRYCELLAEYDIEAPMYRSNKFKDRLAKSVGHLVQFITPLNRTESLLIFPCEASSHLMRKHVTSDEEAGLKEILIADATFETADLDQEILSWLFRVALKIRGDLHETPGHTVIGNINVKQAEKVVPESLYLFLKLVCSSDEELFDDEADDGASCDTLHARILSIAQDIVFLASGGKKETPKHQGIGLTIHQATRSKKLVQLLHAAGHSISYESVLRSDTSIANDAITRFNRHGHLLPRNFEGKQLSGYIRFANDNIDINEETLSGKGTFHASQTAAFMFPGDDSPEEELQIERGVMRSVQVPDYFLSLKDSDIGTAKPEPSFVSEVSTGVLTKDHDLAVYADAKDIAWFLSRNVDRNNQKIPLWSGFNQQLSTERVPQTVVGHLPIINFPAHEYDTIWTVIQNCIGMTKTAGQRHTVFTFDEQLYCKAKLLQWHTTRL